MRTNLLPPVIWLNVIVGVIVDGQWGDWSTFVQCSVTCGQGTWTRTRECNQPSPKHGGQQCEGSDLETMACQLNICPVDGQWSDWSTFEHCSVTCGQGTRTRTRECNQPSPQHGGQQCEGSSTESFECNTHICQVDGRWGQWSKFTPCSDTCGGGNKIRTRSCDQPEPQNGGHDCVGDTYDIQTCGDVNCSSSNVQTGSTEAFVGWVAGSVALVVLVGVTLVCFLIFRRVRQNDNRNISVNRPADTQGIEVDPVQYEQLTERTNQNTTYMELKVTEYESIDENPRQYLGAIDENTGYQNV